MASSSYQPMVIGMCSLILCIKEQTYNNIEFLVLKNLCYQCILRHNFLKEYSNVEIPFGVPRKPLKIYNLTILNVPSPTLFCNLATDYKPIAIKARQFSLPHQEDIDSEITRILREGIIEERYHQ
uniref:Putative LOC100164298 [Acyrthosiphon pisum] n=1 Tax=Lepeophtheirus salmonis TaxID=72036 RepID=A0A0K2UBL9_LEPSM